MVLVYIPKGKQSIIYDQVGILNERCHWIYTSCYEFGYNR